MSCPSLSAVPSHNHRLGPEPEPGAQACPQVMQVMASNQPSPEPNQPAPEPNQPAPEPNQPAFSQIWWSSDKMIVNSQVSLCLCSISLKQSMSVPPF